MAAHPIPARRAEDSFCFERGLASTHKVTDTEAAVRVSEGALAACLAVERGRPAYPTLELFRKRNADRIKRQVGRYIPEYDNGKSGAVPVTLIPRRSEEKQRCIERLYAALLAHKSVCRVAGGVAVPFRVEGLRRLTVENAASDFPELLSEAALWLIESIDRYEARDFDYPALIRQRVEGALLDLVESENRNHFQRVDCLTCGGKGWIEARRRNCVDCRGRGFTFQYKLDPIENHAPGSLDTDAEDGPKLADGAANPEERVLSREACRQIRSSIERLPTLQKKLIYAQFYDELGQADAARGLCISQPTASRQVRAALSRLKKTVTVGPSYRRAVLMKPQRGRDWWGQMRARNGAAQPAPLSFSLTIRE